MFELAYRPKYVLPQSRNHAIKDSRLSNDISFVYVILIITENYVRVIQNNVGVLYGTGINNSMAVYHQISQAVMIK